jgi:hypothetical protein
MTMNKYLETAFEASLFVVATVIAFIPELRTPTMGTVMNTLFVVVAVPGFVRIYRSGLLRATPSQILHAKERPKVSLLSAAGMLMAVAATTVLALK